jgi:hypothetical protein
MKKAASKHHWLWRALLAVLLGVTSPLSQANKEPVTDKRIVDCLLQGAIRKLGSTIYQAPPRPVSIPAVDCEIRGGDFLVYDRANFATSLSHWLNLAKQGDLNAQIYVAQIFERGLGIEPDYQQAAAWYRKAADAGSPVAQISLAQLYEKGLGVEKNAAEAKRLYAQAFGTEESYEVGLDPGSISDPSETVRELESELAKAQSRAGELSTSLASERDRVEAAERDLAQQRALERELRIELSETRHRLEQRAQDGLKPDKEGEARMAEQQRELQAQRESITRLQSEVAKRSAQAEQLRLERERVAELEANLRSQRRDYERTQEQLSETRRQLADASAELANQKKKLQRERQDASEATAELASQRKLDDESRKLLAADIQHRESRIQDQETTIRRLEERIAQQQSVSRELQSELDGASAQNRELLASAGEAEAARLEVARLNAMLDASNRRIEQLQVEAEGSEEADILRSEVQRLKAETSDYLARIEELESARDVAPLPDLAGPVVQLVDPVVTGVRGAQEVSIAEEVESIAVIGKVSAPAGLLSVTVNGKPVPLNERNVFRSDLELQGRESAVRIIAVDNQGKRAERSLTFVRDIVTEAFERETKTLPEVDFGKFYALLIGNEEYRALPDLETPKEDIEVIGEILRSRYGFETITITDGTREKIMDSMYELLGKLTSEDNLLIYYAGHGEYVADTNRGVWLPVDANPNSPANWISNVEISDYLKQIRAKQILVVADSCYSGALTRSALINLRPGLTDEEYEAHLQKMSKVLARVVLTSGALAPVLDAGGPNSQHSVFAGALIEVLSQNDTILSGQDLSRTIAAKVSLAADRIGFEQEPQYAPLNGTNHQGGDFFFVPEYF